MDLCAVEEVTLAPRRGQSETAHRARRSRSRPASKARVRPRSGLALRHAITMPNAPGTIDPGYRGELRVILLNLGREPYVIHAGDRIAQLVVARYEAVEWDEAELSDSARGAGGFGSSGR